MSVEPLRDVRNHFSDVVDRVEHQHERVTVTRNGRPVAVIISPADLEELEETPAVSVILTHWPIFAQPTRPMPPVTSFAAPRPYALIGRE